MPCAYVFHKIPYHKKCFLKSSPAKLLQMQSCTAQSCFDEVVASVF